MKITISRFLVPAVAAVMLAAGLLGAPAVAADLPLYTRNPGDFTGLSHVLDIVAV